MNHLILEQEEGMLGWIGPNGVIQDYTGFWWSPVRIRVRRSFLFSLSFLYYFFMTHFQINGENYVLINPVNTRLCGRMCIEVPGQNCLSVFSYLVLPPYIDNSGLLVSTNPPVLP